ncbi:MAG: LamG-like jellyroll fold domain-containing protein [Pirellulaceae bacterium]
MSRTGQIVSWICLCGMSIGETGRAEMVQSGLILHLDAAIQIEQAGRSVANERWVNLVSDAGEAATLHHLSEALPGFAWSGDGSRFDPYALSFDGQRGYVTGPTSLERPELTLEIWARVDDVRQGIAARGATLLGNDFGQGGLSFLIDREGTPIILHERQFSAIGTPAPLRQWSQFVAVVQNEQVVIYINGQPVGTGAAPRTLDPVNHGGFQLGTARMPDMDYVAADGLIGAIALVRVYQRSLAPQEVLANFEHDRARFPLRPVAPLEPASSHPTPPIPGLAAPPPLRAVKWDYVEQPVHASAPVAAAGLPGQAAVHAAFDSYPTQLDQPYPPNQWRTDPAKKGEPLAVTVVYPRPVAITRFVHYFDETPPMPAAWKDVEIQVSDDQLVWRSVQQLCNLPPQSPQVLGLDQPTTARFYRIEIQSLADGVPALLTNEIETWHGTTIGNVVCEGEAIQSEPYALRVRIASPDTPLQDAHLIVRAAEGTFLASPEFAVPESSAGSGAEVALDLIPLIDGPLTMTLELRAGNVLIDQRPLVLAVKPKLALQDISLPGATLAAVGDPMRLQGLVINNGRQVANAVQVRWLDQQVALGQLAPGQTSSFDLTSQARAGYQEGILAVTADEHTRTQWRRAVVSAEPDALERTVGGVHFRYTAVDQQVRWTAHLAETEAPLSGAWLLLADGRPCTLSIVHQEGVGPLLAAVIPHGVFLMRPAAQQEDAQWQCQVVPDDPNPVIAPWANLDLRLAIDNPQVMFRPHLDWYTAAHGPNYPHLLNGHHSATRMLCLQSGSATISLVPDTDNLNWGFTAENQMTAQFQIPLDARSRLRPDRWRPITESPDCFSLTMPVLGGDWWAAYQHVVQDIFRFEQPRQWAMPITHLQMLTTRELMSAQAWSEKHQIVRCLSDDNVFWTFYATAYTTPALYQWYLATDNETARVKAEKMIDWLLRVQHREGPMRGAWFSAYFDQGPDQQDLIGGDFIRNRWLIAHATGAVVKTLLWYDRASGGHDPRVLKAAGQGCDWLLKTMREDGGWPYAFDLEGQAITQACGAGQIWNTWALWRMYQVTGNDQYRAAAIKSKEFFQKTYMDVHRYVGYWEDTVGITKENNQTIRSWEAYEPAVATLVFQEMGDPALALAAARDAATWSWTRVTSTRHYETCYGQTTEQATCGPSQAQSPLVGVAFHAMFESTGEQFWSDLSGAVKAVNFCADPDQEYGMVATSGWCIPQYAVAGPPYENTRPFVSPNMRQGDYGRQLWTGWCTDQFAWLALEWLVREANLRAPDHVQVDPENLRGTVLGEEGRVKMPEDKCDLTGLEHYDFNWIGYQNERCYMLVVMNHKEAINVLVRPHEAHLGVYTGTPRVLVGSGGAFDQIDASRAGVNWRVEIPPAGTAMLIWDRIR